MDKVALLSLASDLKRITQSIQRNSASVKVFNQEAQKWLKIAKKTNDLSILKVLIEVEKLLKRKDNLLKAEDCLMYSVLIQNRVRPNRDGPGIY